MFICRSEDRIDARTRDDLTLEERWGIASKPSRKGQARREKEGNVETELDVANGARGRIAEIVLDADEPVYDPEASEVRLNYLPPYILVKMYKT